MAPFIKYTEVIRTASGDRTSYVFINAAMIAKATYDEANGTLAIIPTYDAHTKPLLTGDEAKEALEVLRNLK